MEKRKLSCNEMVKLFEDAIYEKKSFCVYVKGKFSKSTYFVNRFEVENNERSICFRDYDACGLECSLQKDGIKDICNSENENGKTIEIILNNDIEIDFMIV
jgi:hypothetical protein